MKRYILQPGCGIKSMASVYFSSAFRELFDRRWRDCVHYRQASVGPKLYSTTGVLWLWEWHFELHVRVEYINISSSNMVHVPLFYPKRHTLRAADFAKIAKWQGNADIDEGSWYNTPYLAFVVLHHGGQ